MIRTLPWLGLIAFLAVAFSAAPALGDHHKKSGNPHEQGHDRGKHNGHEKRPEHVGEDREIGSQHGDDRRAHPQHPDASKKHQNKKK